MNEGNQAEAAPAVARVVLEVSFQFQTQKAQDRLFILAERGRHVFNLLVCSKIPNQFHKHATGKVN